MEGTEFHSGDKESACLAYRSWNSLARYNREETKPRPRALQTDDLSSRGTFFGDDLSNDSIELNCAIGLHARVTTSDEQALLLLKHAMSFESVAVSE